ncbi:MAG: magnesium transporter [Candidatus Cyclobacteriaceae bacterium M2_1C_046]
MSTDQTIEFELTREFLDRMHIAIEERDAAFIQRALKDVNPADISALLHEFNAGESKFVLDQFDNKIGAEIIKDLDPDIRTRFLKTYKPKEISEIITHLDSDDAVDILNELPIKEREEIIATIEDPEREEHIIDLMRYEEDVAGGLMAKELIKANLNWSVVQCIDEIRRQAENVEKIYSVYVVDDNEILLGVVALKRIILANDQTRIADLYEKEIIAVETYMSEEEVASVMQKYDLEAVPVINVNGKLVGRITVDDIIDVITEMAEEERQIMAGISEDVEEADSIWMLSRARLPWLIIGIVGGVLSAQFMGLFEEDLIRVAAIAFFIPLIQATGGNVGIQSSSIVVQTLSNPSAFDESLSRRLIKVLLVAILNGIVLSTLVYGLNIITSDDQQLSFVVSIALLCVVVIASFMGTVTPLILNKFGFNPALASGPFITTTNDLLGLGIYFYTVHILL